MLNITRVHSAVHSVGSLQRSLSIARAYPGVRAIKGRHDVAEGRAAARRDARGHLLAASRIEAFDVRHWTVQGTITICGLDLIRAVAKNSEAIGHYMSDTRGRELFSPARRLSFMRTSESNRDDLSRAPQAACWRAKMRVGKDIR
ncbi:hypothetical protein K466DRAFT_606374 [Polyporus arcularius HHB13444]|uniref:Uncharacterized protein n=1 Tax=Polyporus arcularius HHB13444 TaxID=1314778 RepID=A0A5C3P077_9APHY|nr:hypothetical protein K466DRAFT_606374 [Polyporus arcularius HHB13444]